jgi:hypothetical protein
VGSLSSREDRRTSRSREGDGDAGYRIEESEWLMALTPIQSMISRTFRGVSWVFLKNLPPFFESDLAFLRITRPFFENAEGILRESPDPSERMLTTFSENPPTLLRECCRHSQRIPQPF